jgi:hypothetical protein
MRKRNVLAAGAIALGAMIVLVLAFLAPPGGKPPASRSTSGSPSAPIRSGSPSSTVTDGLFYPDGIPRTWQGQPVLRGQAALDAANASTDSTPFYVAFWAGHQWDKSCPLLAENDPLFGCGDMSNVGDQPGVVSPLLEMQLRVTVESVAPAPVIARVHTHDDACPNPTACQDIMVGDVVWSGGDTTAPHPVTVSQAAAAFGTTTLSFAPPLPICPAWDLPGIPVLPFRSKALSAAPTSPNPDGIIAVFPSARALTAVAPDVAAKGESNVAPGGSIDCTMLGTDTRRGLHWLARANVLVGVKYDAALGPDKDPAVVEARADILKLPDQ